jgi:hypothetical protein
MSLAGIVTKKKGRELHPTTIFRIKIKFGIIAVAVGAVAIAIAVGPIQASGWRQKRRGVRGNLCGNILLNALKVILERESDPVL